MILLIPVLIRSQERARLPLARGASSGAIFSGWAWASSSELFEQPSLKGDINFSDRAFGGRRSILAVENEMPLAVRTCRADCLTYPALEQPDQINFFPTPQPESILSMTLNPMKFTANFKNCIYLLTCTHCDTRYVGESITPLNLRMNIHRRGKWGWEISIDDFRTIDHFQSTSLKSYQKMVMKME